MNKNTKSFISFGSIDQFRTIIKNISYAARYVGKDEEGNANYDDTKPLPVVYATGTEKIHGTNAAVCFNNKDGFWVQSRKTIIGIGAGEKDNAGCAFAAHQNFDAWTEIIEALDLEHNVDLNNNTISVYYEWCGGNIQKNACVSGLDKRAIIFGHFKVTPHNEDPAYWLPTCVTVEGAPNFTWVSNPERNIFNVVDFPMQVVEIDFNRPDIAQNKMIEIVAKNEMNSPIGTIMKAPEVTILEGYVFTFTFDGDVYRFKVKGEEHSKGSGKVKTLKPVDSGLEQKKVDFVNEHACKEFRLEQIYNETFDVLNGGKGDIKKTDDFIRNFMADVIKEESDIMVEMGLEPKTVNGKIAQVVKGYMQSRIDQEAGL